MADRYGNAGDSTQVTVLSKKIPDAFSRLLDLHCKLVDIACIVSARVHFTHFEDYFND